MSKFICNTSTYENRKRIESLDLLKGIGIIMVLVGHSQITGVVHTVIYNFHMALFFTVSGILFRGGGNYISQIKKDAKHLLIPYLFFFAVWNIWHIVTRTLSPHPFSWHQLLLGYDILDEHCSRFYAAIWFLPCLFVVKTFAWWLNKLIKNKIILLLVSFCLYMLGWGINKSNIDIPFCIDTAISVLLFFNNGVVFRSFIDKFKSLPLIWALIGMVIYCVSCIVLLPFVNLKYNIFPIYHCVLATLGIFSLLRICFCFEDSKRLVIRFIKYLGEISIVLLGLHRVVFSMYGIIVPSMNIVFLDSIIMVLISIILISTVERFLTKNFPSFTLLIGK